MTFVPHTIKIVIITQNSIITLTKIKNSNNYLSTIYRTQTTSYTHIHMIYYKCKVTHLLLNMSWYNNAWCPGILYITSLPCTICRVQYYSAYWCTAGANAVIGTKKLVHQHMQHVWSHSGYNRCHNTGRKLFT